MLLRNSRNFPTIYQKIGIKRAACERTQGYAQRILGKSRLSLEREEKGTPRDSASFSPSPFAPFPAARPSRFLDFLPVWPRLNYRKPCFGCHGRIPISRRVARVAGTPYGVSRILYEFLSWNDSFICLSSIPSPPPPPPAPLPSPARPSLAPPLPASATGTAESLSIPICLSFHLTEPQTWRAFCRGPDGWISRASKPATELAQSGCEN